MFNDCSLHSQYSKPACAMRLQWVGYGYNLTMNTLCNQLGPINNSQNSKQLIACAQTNLLTSNNTKQETLLAVSVSHAYNLQRVFV